MIRCSMQHVHCTVQSSVPPAPDATVMTSQRLYFLNWLIHEPITSYCLMINPSPGTSFKIQQLYIVVNTQTQEVMSWPLGCWLASKINCPPLTWNKSRCKYLRSLLLDLTISFSLDSEVLGTSYSPIRIIFIIGDMATWQQLDRRVFDWNPQRFIKSPAVSKCRMQRTSIRFHSELYWIKTRLITEL